MKKYCEPVFRRYLKDKAIHGNYDGNGARGGGQGGPEGVESSGSQGRTEGRRGLGGRGGYFAIRRKKEGGSEVKLTEVNFNTAHTVLFTFI